MKQIRNWAGLASETGSILAYMIEQGLRPEFVLVDCQCEAERRLKALGVEVINLPRRGRFYRNTGQCDEQRAVYTREVRALMEERGIELLVMAGWMTVFSPDMSGLFVLNTHPALLPAFKGNHPVKDALAFGVKVTGCTVHVATAALDDGPILAQRAVEIGEGEGVEDADTVQERIKEQERPLYTDVVRRILAGEIDLEQVQRDWEAKRAA